MPVGTGEVGGSRFFGCADSLAAVRVFVVVAPLDMRGSFDALVGAVRRLGLEPTDGHLYLFLNKRRRIAKTPWFDGSGWCVLAKRLERVGTAATPAAKNQPLTSPNA